MEPIPFIDLKAQRDRLGDKIDNAILAVVNHGKYIMGPEVAELETRLADYCGVDHCISCSSGTDALLMPLMAKGIGPGDAVFVPAFTFAATAEVVALIGAEPVFTDVRRDTFNMDVASLKAAILDARERGLNPAAIIPVDLFGQPADYASILPIAEEEGLFVVSDAAQSLGGSLGEKPVGSFGLATATSFFPAKPLGCYGDGGAIFTDNDELAGAMRSIRVHGKGDHKYDNARVGLNARLDTIQAAVLLQKMTIFPDEIGRRQSVAEGYSEGLSKSVVVPSVLAGATSAWAQYTIQISNRDKLSSELSDAGVPSAVYYPMPLNRQAAYKGCPVNSSGTPNADYLSQHVLSLPMHPYIATSTVERVVDCVARSTGIMR
jgi:dTDP-4-amino-4,6-dideoxygalactose transaminase